MLSFVEGAGYVDNETKICEKKNIPSRKLTGIPPNGKFGKIIIFKMDTLQGDMYISVSQEAIIPNIENLPSGPSGWLPCPSGGDFPRYLPQKTFCDTKVGYCGLLAASKK